jgi:prepilin-type processing-associated H-X9-DG protein
VQKITDITTNICYVLTQGGIQGDNGNLPSSGWWPFGYDASGPPHLISTIPSEAGLPLSSVWALCDADQVSTPNAGWSSQCPIQPVHGSVRNFLYFDNHVGIKHVGPTQYYWNPKYGPEYN